MFQLFDWLVVLEDKISVEENPMTVIVLLVFQYLCTAWFTFNQSSKFSVKLKHWTFKLYNCTAL